MAALSGIGSRIAYYLALLYKQSASAAQRRMRFESLISSPDAQIFGS
jgi:hypothetical protein